MIRQCVHPVLVGAALLAGAFSLGTTHAQAAGMPNMAPKEVVVKRGISAEASKCIECHAQKTPGIIEAWKQGKMGHANITCYDCHVVDKNSPMASQCSGIKGSKTFISPMVSSKTRGRCHPTEVKQFQQSAHADLARIAVYDKNKAGGKLVALQLHHEGGGFMGVEEGSAANGASRQSGCQVCHGSEVKVGPDNKPLAGTWPAGVGTKYPDGSVGNCTVCHTRHQFSVAEARKPRPAPVAISAPTIRISRSIWRASTARSIRPREKSGTGMRHPTPGSQVIIPRPPVRSVT